MVAVALFGSVSAVAAGVIERWNTDAAEHFDINKDEQRKLSEQGYAKNLQNKKSETDVLTATDNGITITAKQTLVDNHSMRIYFRIKSTKGVKLDIDKQYFQKWELEGGNYDCKFAGMEDLKNNSDYEKGFWIEAGNSKGTPCDMNGKTIHVRLKNLMSENIKDLSDKEKVIVKGEWKLSWKVTGNNKAITIPLNRTIRQGNATIQLEKMQLSPLSYKMDYTVTGKGSKNLSNIVVIYKMKDGTVYNASEDDEEKGTLITGYGVTGPDGQTEVFDTKLLDVENLKSIVIGGEEFPVK